MFARSRARKLTLVTRRTVELLNRCLPLVLTGLLAQSAAAQGSGHTKRVISSGSFTEEFKGKLAPGWYWVREHKEAWRLSEHGLEVLIEPGNMWGPQNDAKNVLLLHAPRPGTEQIQIDVTFEHAPTNQYEQADLVWYFDDSNMVKLGEELVDGKLSIVMGREEMDKTRTISITPLTSNKVHLRMRVTDRGITGSFQIPGTDRWTTVGQCELPKSPNVNATPKTGLQFYQGVAGSGHWARVTDFRPSISPAESGKSEAKPAE